MATEAMTSPELNALLDDLAGTLASVDQTINQLTAVRTAMLATVARIADDEPFDSVDSRELARRAVATEIAAVLRLSDRVVEGQMGDAALLVNDFPKTAAAFGAGRISQAHLRIILEAGTPIETGEARARFESVVVPRAEVESPNRLRPFVKQAAEQMREISFTERHREAHEKRGAWVRSCEDAWPNSCSTVRAPSSTQSTID